MLRKTQFAAVAAATLIAGTAGAFAQGYAHYDSMAWVPGPGYAAGPADSYDAVPPRPTYYRSYGWNGYGTYGNGTNHPTPGSTQGDVGPQGNNNGTVTGVYRYQPW
ncbi:MULTISPECIES: hypothetical protein [unclassified Bradyrhizobium]|uniref:hypothetical protein n=1 Tax=unclassified Bradyrhizobium TaxID=2631580 RepID=UPI0028EFA41D|nr:MULTISPECIES: hypothetical protein [unclassified Bradyrhizobium]